MKRNTKDHRSSDFDPTHISHLVDGEDRHFWYRARNHIIRTAVTQIASQMDPGYMILEMGCGDGNTMRIVQDACRSGQVIGMDMDSEDLKYARKRGLDYLIQGDIHSPPFSERFNAICLFDVLEHLSDDDKVLLKLHHMIKDDGYILLTVPAHPSMWSYADEIAHHYRRYKIEALEGKLIQSGFHVEYISYYMAGIFPLVWTIRRLRNMVRRGTAQDLALDERKIVPIVNEILTAILTQEAWIIARRWKIPFGTSLIALGRKR